MAKNQTLHETQTESATIKLSFKENFQRLTKKGFFLYLPPIQAAIVFIICLVWTLVAVSTKLSQSDLWDFLISALILFSVVSPFTYVFVLKWWRNSLLFVISAIVLNLMINGLGEAVEDSLPGPGIGEGAIAVIIAWLAPFAIVPFSGLIHLLINKIRETTAIMQVKGKRIMNKVSIAFGIIIVVIILPYTALLRIILTTIVGHSIHFATLNIIDGAFELFLLIGALSLSIIALVQSRSLDDPKRIRTFAVISILITLLLAYLRVDSILLWSNLEDTGIHIID
jgi:hypothetical protein